MSSASLSRPLTAVETVTLDDDAPGGRARVAIAPERGGMVTRFEVAGRQVLFLDEATLLDPTRNVRGGNPVLFPSPGSLTGDTFTRDGRTGRRMKQHGFARQMPWTVLARGAREVTLELESSDLTRAQFPWALAVRLRYALEGAKLTVETTITNHDAAAMPFALGFHPYFLVPDAEKAEARIDTDATRAFDNVTKAMVEVRGPIDLTKPEVDLHLHDHTARSATLQRGTRDHIRVTADPELGRWVVWTLAGKDFVCLEPWSAPGDALNAGSDLLVLPAGAAKTLTMSIALERGDGEGA